MLPAPIMHITYCYFTSNLHDPAMIIIRNTTWKLQIKLTSLQFYKVKHRELY